MTIYRDNIVAYLDILGFKEALRDEAKAKNIVDAFNSIKKNRSQSSTSEYEQISENTGNIKLTQAFSMFSDSMHMSMSEDVLKGPISWGNVIFRILGTISILTGFLILNTELLIRGGLAFGKLYHEDDIFLGQAQIDAVELEQTKLAKYPGIRVDDKVVELFNRHYSDGSNGGYFLLENDGYYYVDVFSRIHADQRKADGNFIEDILKVINSQLIDIDQRKGGYEHMSHDERMKTKSKWTWYQEKASDFLRKSK